MVEHINEVKTEFDKILQAIKKDKSLLKVYFGDKKFTVQNLSDIACNHLFDDYPDLFGITKHEGHKVREYFHNCRPDTFTRQLHNVFPDIFEEETPEYLKYINSLR